MLDPDALDLAEIGRLLDGNDYRGGYLDPATGEVVPVFDDEVLGDDGEPIDVEETDWIGIPGEGSRQAYLDMADFAAAVADRDLARRLADALDGKGAFRRFRNVIFDHPDVVGPAWRRFGDARSAARAVDWLEAQQLVAPDATERASTALEDDATAALEGVGGPAGSSRGRGAVVDLRDKLGMFSEHWSPKVIARLNDYEVKLAKLEGEFIWHVHDDTDELYVVPRGVEHCPVTRGEVAVMLVEPAGVVNTGGVGADLTAAYDDSLLD